MILLKLFIAITLVYGTLMVIAIRSNKKALKQPVRPSYPEEVNWLLEMD